MSLPTSIRPRTSASNRIYGYFPGTLAANIGSVPVNTLVVAAVFSGPIGTGNTIGNFRIFASGNTQALTLVQSGATLSSGEAVGAGGFIVGYTFITGLSANNPSLQVLLDYTPSGNQVVDLIAIAYDGVDSNGSIVSAHNDTTVGIPSPTPSVTSPGTGVALSFWCWNDIGTMTTDVNISAGGFGTYEEDDGVPFQVYAASLIEDVAAGATPVRSAGYSTPWPLYGPSTIPQSALRSAVLVLPAKRGDSLDEIST